jgi:hypothetical protein
MGKQDDEIVPVFLVHCRQDLVKFGGYGGMVKHSPVKEGICTCSVGRELGRTPGCHDSYVIGEEPFGCEITRKSGGDLLDLSVGSSIVVSKVPHEEGSVKIIVDEACHHGGQLRWRDGGLGGPVHVVCAYPAEVVTSTMYDG